jgi:DNA-binding NtrC family response regulator
MERVAQEVRNALERVRLETEVEALRRHLGTDTPLLGSSPAMRHLKEKIARVAEIPSPVLIVGESGSGKELVARELHRIGAGPKKPFVAINSAALPENLIESELFGHERGAFTGASRTHRGAFERAAEGTLFLDEIGELPLPAQAKLLRVIEDRRVTRLGGERAIDVSARVIAATNRDLEIEQDAGRFRQDLYFRLSVHILSVPPLRNRASDIPELAEHFLTNICARFGMRRKRLDPEAIQSLMTYEWKRNNVRELRNIIERMIIAADGDVIGMDRVPAELRGGALRESGTGTGTFHERKIEAERQIVVAALEKNDWHITRTAKDLGLADHASLLKIMRRLDLKRN